MRRRGFTLVEVLVALVVLEVGLMGVVGTLLLAAGTLTRARRIDGATAALERVYDSLSSAGAVSSRGRLSMESAEIRWTASASGGLTLQYVLPPDSVVEVLEGQAQPVVETSR